PLGKAFSRGDNREEITHFANELEFPVVVKPTEGSFGRGVITNITSNTELQHAVEYLFDNRLEKEIIVEKFVTGKDYRIYVVENEVVGAILRLPPNVTGDGNSSISKLIDLKNEERMTNPRLIDCLIKKNDELINYIKKKGYSLDS